MSLKWDSTFLCLVRDGEERCSGKTLGTTDLDKVGTVLLSPHYFLAGLCFISNRNKKWVDLFWSFDPTRPDGHMRAQQSSRCNLFFPFVVLSIGYLLPYASDAVGDKERQVVLFVKKNVHVP